MKRDLDQAQINELAAQLDTRTECYRCGVSIAETMHTAKEPALCCACRYHSTAWEDEQLSDPEARG